MDEEKKNTILCSLAHLVFIGKCIGKYTTGQTGGGEGHTHNI